MGTLRKEAVVGVTCWEFQPIYSRLWCFPLSCMAPKFGEVTWKALIGKSPRRAWRCIWCLTSKCDLQLPIIFLLAEFGELPIELYTLKLTMGFQQQLAHLTPSWLVSKATSLSRNQVEQGFNTWHKWTTMWKTSFSLGNPWQTKHIKNNIWWYEGGFSLLRSRTLSISLGRN